MVGIWLLFIGLGALIGWLFSLLIPSSKNHVDKPDNFIINNTIHQTHNHLHVTKEDLKDLIDK